LYEVLGKIDVSKSKKKLTGKKLNSSSLGPSFKSGAVLKYDISGRKRVDYPKLNYNGMQELENDRLLED
jgi:hypothetical protein